MVFNTESQVHDQAPQCFFSFFFFFFMFKLQCHVIFSVQQLVCSTEYLGMGLGAKAIVLAIITAATPYNTGQRPISVQQVQ